MAVILLSLFASLTISGTHVAVLLHETEPGYEVGLGQAIRLIGPHIWWRTTCMPARWGCIQHVYRGRNHLLFLITEADDSNVWNVFGTDFVT